MHGRGEGVVGTLQIGEAPRTFNDIAGKDVAQHRCLASTGRSVDPHQTTCISQINQRPVDGELLTQRQAMLGIRGPPPFRQPVDPNSGVSNGAITDNVQPPPYGEISVGGQVLRQCRWANSIRQPSRDGREIVEEETVEKASTHSRAVGRTQDSRGRNDDALASQARYSIDSQGLVHNVQ